MVGDGYEERLGAYLLGERLRADPNVKQRRDDYHRKVDLARKAALTMPKDAVIDALCKRTPAYIRSRLETEDDRFGPGALADRYAHTFWKDQA
jgi:hypothetical protein